MAVTDERVTDGRRIAELLASELDGRDDGALARVAVEEADPDAEPSAAGTHAYAVDADGDRLASVYLHPDEARIEFGSGGDAAARAAREAGLRVHRSSGSTAVSVRSGVEAKRAAAVVTAAL